MPKVEFGIALDENLAYVLDRLAAKMRISRSELIQRILADHLEPTADARLQEIEAAAIEAVREAIGERLAVIQSAYENVAQKLAEAQKERERLNQELNALAIKLDPTALSVDEATQLKRTMGDTKERLAATEEIINELTARLKDIQSQKASLLKEGWRAFVEIYEPEAFALIDEEIKKLAAKIVEVRNDAHRVLSRTRKVQPASSTELVFDRLYILATEALPKEAWNRELRRKHWAREMSGDSPALDPDGSLLDWVKARGFDAWPNGLADENLTGDLTPR